MDIIVFLAVGVWAIVYFILLKPKREKAREQALTQREVVALIVLDSYGYREGCESYEKHQREVRAWLADMGKEINNKTIQNIVDGLFEKDFFDFFSACRKRVTIEGKIALTSYENYPQALESWETFHLGGSRC